MIGPSCVNAGDYREGEREIDRPCVCVCEREREPDRREDRKGEIRQREREGEEVSEAQPEEGMQAQHTHTSHNTLTPRTPPTRTSSGTSFAASCSLSLFFLMTL